MSLEEAKNIDITYLTELLDDEFKAVNNNIKKENYFFINVALETFKSYIKNNNYISYKSITWASEVYKRTMAIINILLEKNFIKKDEITELSLISKDIISILENNNNNLETELKNIIEKNR